MRLAVNMIVNKICREINNDCHAPGIVSGPPDQDMRTGSKILPREMVKHAQAIDTCVYIYIPSGVPL